MVSCLALFIAILVYIVLVQKQAHTEMLGVTQVEKGKAELERHLTAALAHVLRNPLGAIDCALKTMPDDLSADVKELIASMQLCSSFMASIMNNLLDSRKLEEGKMTLLNNPLSLSQLLQTVHKMMLPTVNDGVTLIVNTSKIGEERDLVYGDDSRLQEILTNLVR
jgi:signal transduction histidine kinase